MLTCFLGYIFEGDHRLEYQDVARTSFKEEYDVIILCGGLGTRLDSQRHQSPKSLTDVDGIPLMQLHFEMLKSIPISRIILATSFLADKIVNFVAKTPWPGAIKFSHSDKLLGTGGALQKAIADYWPVTPGFFVLSGDVLCNTNLSRMAAQRDRNFDGSIMAVNVENSSEYGKLITDRNMRLRDFQEKRPMGGPGLVDGGFYFFHHAIMSYFPKKESFSLEYEVFPYATNLYAHLHTGPWIDVGTPERASVAAKTFSRARQWSRRIAVPEAG